MVENHFDVIDAEFCLAEGGNNILEASGVKVVGIQTAEKNATAGNTGGAWFSRTWLGATSRQCQSRILANAVAKAGSWKTEMRLNDTTRAYFDRLASISDPEDAWRYLNVGNPAETDAIQQHFLETFPYHYSVLRTSVVPTVMKAGFRNNVIPSEATAILDIRMLPDEDVDAFYQKLADVIDDPQVTVVPEAIYRPESEPSPIDNDMFQSLEKVAKRMYPEATVIPSMSTGATDMAQTRSMGVPSYGIGPVRSIEEMNSGRGAHGDNERVSEEAMKQLVQFLWYTTIDIAATK